MNKFELIRFQKTKEGKYLRNYELTYLNKAGKEKTYEIVSRRDLKSADDLGQKASGVSIVATCGDKLLLLREFRMGVNREIFNLCAGMLSENESIEECIRRELYEETGLEVQKILRILPPSFSAVAISDVSTYIAYVEVAGTISDHTSVNESIEPAFYSAEELMRLIETESFSSRAQLAAYQFAAQQLFAKQ